MQNVAGQMESQFVCIVAQLRFILYKEGNVMNVAKSYVRNGLALPVVLSSMPLIFH